MRRKTAVWTSTNRCNLNCRFCFGKEEKEELGTAAARRMIEELGEGGAARIVFSGGEPLLRKDIFGLAGYAKNIGLKTVLHTNGILVNRRNTGKIAQLFDAVNLPVDGADEKANARMGRGSLKHTLDAIGMLSGKTRITVSTVATKINLGEIPKIAGLLSGMEIWKWRIYMFEPRLGEARRNRGLFGISRGEFAALRRKVKAENAEFIAPGGEFGKSYSVISSDGTITI